MILSGQILSFAHDTLRHWSEDRDEAGLNTHQKYHELWFAEKKTNSTISSNKEVFYTKSDDGNCPREDGSKAWCWIRCNIQMILNLFP